MLCTKQQHTFPVLPKWFWNTYFNRNISNHYTQKKKKLLLFFFFFSCWWAIILANKLIILLFCTSVSLWNKSHLNDWGSTMLLSWIVILLLTTVWSCSQRYPLSHAVTAVHYLHPRAASCTNICQESEGKAFSTNPNPRLHKDRKLFNATHTPWTSHGVQTIQQLIPPWIPPNYISATYAIASVFWEERRWTENGALTF